MNHEVHWLRKFYCDMYPYIYFEKKVLPVLKTGICEITEKGSIPLLWLFLFARHFTSESRQSEISQKQKISGNFQIWLLKIKFKVFSRNKIVGVRTLITFNTFMLYITQTTKSGWSVCTCSM